MVKSCDDMGNTVSKTPQKIGIVFDDSLDKPDGVQQYILSLGGWLVREGHEVHYLVGQTSRTDIDNVHALSRNVNVTFNGNQLSIPLPISTKKTKQFLMAQKFDVLHVQVPYSPWLAHKVILAAPQGTTIVGTFHIVAFSKFVQLATRCLAIWTKRSTQRFAAIVSVSTAAKAYARATYKVSTDVLPNVFDYSRFHSAQPLLPVAPGKIRIMFLGRLVERKGCQYLLEAVGILKAKGIHNIEVVICGKGPLATKLQDYVKVNNLPVTFAGFVSEADKPGYYASADIAVFPSTGGESFGIVLLEAMASGRTAVLAASNSGYASVMEPRSDLLFPPKDVTSLAARLENLIKNDSDRKHAAAWGATYSREFDVPAVGVKLLKYYELPPASS